MLANKGIAFIRHPQYLLVLYRIDTAAIPPLAIQHRTAMAGFHAGTEADFPNPFAIADLMRVMHVDAPIFVRLRLISVQSAMKQATATVSQ